MHLANIIKIIMYNKIVNKKLLNKNIIFNNKKHII